MRHFAAYLLAEHRAQPWMFWGLSISGAAAFGSALPDLIALAQRVLA